VQNDETLAIDDGMKWMVDFGEAERIGMALRLTLPPTAGRHASGLSSCSV
jgi:hypothetical protein